MFGTVLCALSKDYTNLLGFKGTSKHYIGGTNPKEVYTQFYKLDAIKDYLVL